MKKKLLGLVLAATMLFGASMTVCAEDVSGQGTVSYSSTVETVTINVTLTTNTSNSVIVNPYGLAATGADAAVSTNTLIIKDIAFENKSNVPIQLGLKGQVSTNDATITISSTVQRPNAQTTAKQANVNVTFEDVSGNVLASKGVSAAADAPTSYTKTLAPIANSPVLAAQNKAGANQTSKVILKFDGWTMAASTATWPSTSKIDVITSYDIRGAEPNKISVFKAKN